MKTAGAKNKPLNIRVKCYVNQKQAIDIALDHKRLELQFTEIRKEKKSILLFF